MNDEEVFSLDGPDAPKVDGVDTLNDRVFDDYAKRFRGVDDAVLVVDYGSFSCKAGWSAEHNPRRTSLVVACVAARGYSLALWRQCCFDRIL